MKIHFKILFLIILFMGCQDDTNFYEQKLNKGIISFLKKYEKIIAFVKENRNIEYTGQAKTIHIFVPLCDNKYQGIVPVPKAIGNGQDPVRNLYWGAGYGVKNFFKKSKNWQLLKSYKINDTVLERLIFKHKIKNFYIVADAYNGKNIKETVLDYLKSLSGNYKDTLHINDSIIGAYGNSILLIYAGHNGLMDFSMDTIFVNKDKKERDAIILACYSKEFFYYYVQAANADPIIWTADLMPPEAYTILAAINAYIENKDNNQILKEAAEAFAKYQKCDLKIAYKILVTGW